MPFPLLSDPRWSSLFTLLTLGSMAMTDAAMLKLADMLAAKNEATMRVAIKENNAVLLSAMNEQTDEKISSAIVGLKDELLATMKESMSVLKAEIKEEIKAEAPPLDAWQLGRAAAAAKAMASEATGPSGATGSADPHGSAAQRRESSKRRFVESRDPADDPRNQRNVLRVHVKGFHKAVPPAVHRKCYEAILARIGGHLVGATPKTGNFDYKFVVDCQSEAQANQAIELINNLGLEWPDAKDPTIKGTIRAHSDRSPNAKKSNKVYGEIRKMLEEIFNNNKEEMETHQQLGTRVARRQRSHDQGHHSCPQ